MPDELVFLDLAGARVVLSAADGPTEDEPTVTFAPTTDPGTVSAELILRVTDARATYEALAPRDLADRAVTAAPAVGALAAGQPTVHRGWTRVPASVAAGRARERQPASTCVDLQLAGIGED